MSRARFPFAVVVAIGGVLATSGAASTAASPIPSLAQTRILAEYGDAAFVPSWLPPGFRLHSWAVDAGSNAILPDRLRLRLRRGTSDLMWEVAFAHRTETADPATCERKRPSRRIEGRRVYDAGDDAAYVCIAVGAPRWRYAVSVRKVTPSPEIDISDLRRMVAGATRPLPSSARASALVPARQARALRASFDGPVPLPRAMAPGFIFTRGYVQDRSRYYPRTVTALFGRRGDKLMWTVAPTGHGLDARCTRADRRYYRPTVVSGRNVYWIGGAKGQAAWACVTQPKRVTVDLWNDYSVSKRTLMRVVASARW